MAQRKRRRGVQESGQSPQAAVSTDPVSQRQFQALQRAIHAASIDTALREIKEQLAAIENGLNNLRYA